MFKSLDELMQTKRSRFQLWRDAVVSGVSGLVIAAAGFQTVYSLIFAIE